MAKYDDEAVDVRAKRKTARPPFARLAAADELGLVKVVEVPEGPAWDAASVVQVWGQPNRAQAIHALAATTSLAVGSDQPQLQGPGLVAVSRKSGDVQVLDAQDGHELASFACGGDGTALAFRQPPGGQPVSLITCTAKGILRLHTHMPRGVADDAAAPPAWAFSSTDGVQTAPHVACLALDPSQQQHVALGGEGCQLQVWRLPGAGDGERTAPVQVFKAKGAKPNRVGNVDLPHVTATAFLPDSAGQVVLVGTAKRKLWLYDLRAGQRPQLSVSWGEARITSLAAQRDGRRVWAANGAGCVEALDLGMRKMQGAMKGAAGSVRAMALHPAEDAAHPLLAVAGLDRFARVYSTVTRQAQCKAYCKQQLTGIAWLDVVGTDNAPGDAGGAPDGVTSSNSLRGNTTKKQKRRAGGDA